MINTLTWINLNAPGTFSVRIYRGTAPLDRSNLTNPIVTLTNNETTYDDPNAVRDTLYYYVFETTITVNNDKQSTDNIPIRAVPRKGPGPVALVMGDYSYGYYGTLPASSLINTTDLRNAVGISGGVITQPGPLWHKWIRNSKTMYIPNGPIMGNLSWKILYDLGLVFGVDGPGPYNGGANVNQSAQIAIGTDRFRIRCMTGYSDNLAQFPPTGTIGEPTETLPNEWNDLVYPLCMWTPDLQHMANVQQAAISDLGMAITGVVNGMLVQERVSATASSTPIIRGNSTNSRVGIANRTTTVMATATSGWWPVLELMES